MEDALRFCNKDHIYLLKKVKKKEKKNHISATVTPPVLSDCEGIKKKRHTGLISEDSTGKLQKKMDSHCQMKK